jgi:hypothetical protein
MLPLVTILVISGCDKNQLAPIDSEDTAPFVSTVHINPDSIYLDSLTPSNGEYSVSTIVWVRASDVDGASDIATVEVDVSRENGLSAVRGIGLLDNGLAPDSVQGDGVFSGNVLFTLVRAQVGRYMIKARAIDRQGVSSNLLATQLKLTRQNASPTIFNLTAPDSVTRPSTGSLLFSMTISASDSDGLADITEVYFRSIISSTPDVKFFLYDDGGIIQSNGLTSGDRLAGDGVFSIIVQLPSTTSQGERRFAFQAKDTFGDTSATVVHSLIVQ